MEKKNSGKCGGPVQLTAGFLPATRRGFLAGSASAVVALSASKARAEPFSNLRVEPLFDQQTLKAVRLRLSGAESREDDPQITFRPESFSPLTPGRIQLTGLRGPNRDASVPVNAGTTLEITIYDADLFNHRSGNSGRGSIFYRFIVFSQEEADEAGTPIAVWRIRTNTNALLNSSQRGPLDLPEAPFTGDRTSKLAEVMRGEIGISLIVGPGWVRQTLSAVMGGPVQAQYKFIATLIPDIEPDDPAERRRRNDRPDWSWLFRPLTAGYGRCSIADAGLGFETVAFGWKLVPAETPGAEPRPTFLMNFNSGTARGAGLVAPGRKERAEVDGMASFARQRFVTGDDGRTVLTVSADAAAETDPVVTVQARGHVYEEPESDSSMRRFT